MRVSAILTTAAFVATPMVSIGSEGLPESPTYSSSGRWRDEVSSLTPPKSIRFEASSNHHSRLTNGELARCRTWLVSRSL